MSTYPTTGAVLKRIKEPQFPTRPIPEISELTVPTQVSTELVSSPYSLHKDVLKSRLIIPTEFDQLRQTSVFRMFSKIVRIQLQPAKQNIAPRPKIRNLMFSCPQKFQECTYPSKVSRFSFVSGVVSSIFKTEYSLKVSKRLIKGPHQQDHPLPLSQSVIPTYSTKINRSTSKGLAKAR